MFEKPWHQFVSSLDQTAEIERHNRSLTYHHKLAKGALEHSLSDKPHVHHSHLAVLVISELASGHNTTLHLSPSLSCQLLTTLYINSLQFSVLALSLILLSFTALIIAFLLLCWTCSRRFWFVDYSAARHSSGTSKLKLKNENPRNIIIQLNALQPDVCSLPVALTKKANSEPRNEAPLAGAAASKQENPAMSLVSIARQTHQVALGNHNAELLKKLKLTLADRRIDSERVANTEKSSNLSVVNLPLSQHGFSSFGTCQQSHPSTSSSTKPSSLFVPSPAHSVPRMVLHRFDYRVRLTPKGAESLTPSSSESVRKRCSITKWHYVSLTKSN